MIKAEVVIIGAGPVGLFQVFELGLLGIKAHVIETLDKPGGQCSELYPDKPIYDIPACPAIGAQQLTDNLLEQIAPFEATFHFGQEVTFLEKQNDGKFVVKTSTGNEFLAEAVIIAAGMGSFTPVKLRVPGVERFEGNQLVYSVKDPEQYAGKDIVVLGGGDSALDWVLALQPIANSVVLVHRNTKFKAAPASVAKMEALCEAHEMQFLLGNVSDFVEENEKTKRSIKKPNR